MERAEAIKIIKSATVYTPEEMEALETLIPELRESEDERIVKDLIGGLMWQRDNIGRLGPHDDNLILPGFCENVGKHLAWLEKQKEEEGYEAIPVESTLEYKLGFKAGKESEKQKEQPQEELVYRMNGLMQEYIKEGKDGAEKEHRFKCYQLFWDALEDADFFEQKEQKPQGVYVDCTEHPEWYGMPPKEQKPAEWSEEDEKKLGKCIDAVSGYYSPEDKQELKNWLKSLPHRFSLSSWGEEIQTAFFGKVNKEAWRPSEEDKRKLNRIYEILGYAADDKAFLKSKRIIGDKEAIELQDFLKSLRPQPKQEWSEEDEDKLEQCIRIVRSWEGDYDIVKSPYSNFLKSLRPQWRPSEEQMEALKKVTGNAVDADEYYPALATLYYELKEQF